MTSAIGAHESFRFFPWTLSSLVVGQKSRAGMPCWRLRRYVHDGEDLTWPDRSYTAW